MKQAISWFVPTLGGLWLLSMASLAQATVMWNFDVDFSGTIYTGTIGTDNDAPDL
jgi:hypothetical protein